MANTKAAKQDILVNARNRRRNVNVRSRMKTFVKKAEDALGAKDADQVKATLPHAISEIDRAISKGVLHASTGARKKSRLQRQANGI